MSELSEVELKARAAFYASLGIVPDANSGQWANLTAAERDEWLKKSTITPLPEGPPDLG